MLAPDNFQEDPKPVLAHRTSPTNLGLYLLSAIAAHDFGWIGAHETVERMEATLATMSRLELFRGHFYNWYETRDLRPLEPKYVSSVDSGNLAGHLIAFANACREIVGRPIVGFAMAVGDRRRGRTHARVTCPRSAGDLRTHTVTAEAVGRGARRAVRPRSPGIRGLRRRWPRSWRNSGPCRLRHRHRANPDHRTRRRSGGPSCSPGRMRSAPLSIVIGARLELLMPWASLIAADAAIAPAQRRRGSSGQRVGRCIRFDSHAGRFARPLRSGDRHPRTAQGRARGRRRHRMVRLARLPQARARESTRSPTRSRAPPTRPARSSAG